MADRRVRDVHISSKADSITAARPTTGRLVERTRSETHVCKSLLADSHCKRRGVCPGRLMAESGATQAARVKDVIDGGKGLVVRRRDDNDFPYWPFRRWTWHSVLVLGSCFQYSYLAGERLLA